MSKAFGWRGVTVSNEHLALLMTASMQSKSSCNKQKSWVPCKPSAVDIMYAITGAPNLPFKPHSKAHLITNNKAGMHNSVAGILQV